MDYTKLNGYSRRRYINKRLLIRSTAFFLIVLVLPTFLIYWAVIESNRALRSGRFRTLTPKAPEDASNKWKPFFEKMHHRDQLLESSCQYLRFGNEEHSYNDLKSWSVFTFKQANVIVCDVLGITETLLCQSQDADWCSPTNHRRVGLNDLHLDGNPVKNSFLIVQHPFKRIVSYFKGLDADERRKIAKIARADSDDYNLDAALTFEEFVCYIVESLKQKRLNGGWLPIYNACSPCLMEFNDIIHMEDIKEEKNYLLHKIGMESPTNEEEDEIIIPDENEIKYYFSQVRKDFILELYKAYRFDFESFSYKFSTYLEIGIPVPTTVKV